MVVVVLVVVVVVEVVSVIIVVAVAAIAVYLRPYFQPTSNPESSSISPSALMLLVLLSLIS